MELFGGKRFLFLRKMRAEPQRRNYKRCII